MDGAAKAGEDVESDQDRLDHHGYHEQPGRPARISRVAPIASGRRLPSSDRPRRERPVVTGRTSRDRREERCRDSSVGPPRPVDRDAEPRLAGAHDRLSAIDDHELARDRAHVIANRLDTDAEMQSDRRIAGSLAISARTSRSRSVSTRGTAGPPLPGTREEPDHPLCHACSNIASLPDPFDGSQHLLVARVFEQVATRAHRREDRSVVGEHRQDEHGRGPAVRRDLAGRFDPTGPGIARSIRTTSGRTARATSIASSPVVASPMSSIPGDASTSARSPSRTMGWSSATTHRIGAVMVVR